MPSIVDASGVKSDVVQSERRTPALRRDLLDPGAIRRRDLAIYALSLDGYETADIATWFGLTVQRVNQIKAHLGPTLRALGYGERPTTRTDRPTPQTIKGLG